ncbi:MAG: ShlB/FhaC/HecB family hemolysin secretion/activation protein [Verrucomicrobiia bacterium]
MRRTGLPRKLWPLICGLVLLALPMEGQELAAPPLQLPVEPAKHLSVPRLYVREFRFEGNKVFSSQQLAKVTAGYVGREISSLELEDARRAVTEYYVSRGYIDSGAVLPDQNPQDGVVIIRITEGTLSAMRITGNKWLRESYIRDSLQRWSGPPLNMNDLKEGLQLLRQNPNIAQVNAELRPDADPGTSILDIHVQDENPFRLGLQVDNDRPPSVGAGEILLVAGDASLTGHSDPLDVSYGIAEGGYHGFKFSDFNDVSASYLIPLTIYDTTLRIYGSKNDYTVIEEPFNPLDITSESYRVGVTLRQPLYETSSRELALAVTFEREHSETFLLGIPYDITPGSVNGITDITALRIVQEWIDRSQKQVLALRSTFSVGLDAFGVTDDGSDRNAHFFTWLGQAQYVRRLFNTPNQLVLRVNGQVTPRPLLALEQFTLGGADSVRGYLVDQIVRDDGVFSSVELRVPVVFNGLGAPIVQFAPFFDFGGAWNVGASTPPPTTISSAGVGVLFSPNEHLNAQLYWGYAFRKFANANDDLQDLGITFKVSYEAF